MSDIILFVDDSPVIKKIVKRTIESLGFEFGDANNGKEGLAYLEKNSSRVKLVISDWNMPEMNGYDFLKKIKSSEVYKSIPVIMATTEAEKSNINRALEAGASQYILKPFNPGALTQLIKKILVLS